MVRWPVAAARPIEHHPGGHDPRRFRLVLVRRAQEDVVDPPVLLVDADMRRPGVHQAFGMEGCPGLTEYLFDETPLGQLLIHPGIGRFVFLPGGRAIMNSAEALASPRMGALVSDLKHRYHDRLIVFDLPPLLSRADVLGFAPHIDALLLVVEEGRTGSTNVERAMTVLKGSVPILGGVLNKSGRVGMTRRRAKDQPAGSGRSGDAGDGEHSPPGSRAPAGRACGRAAVRYPRRHCDQERVSG